MLAVKVGGALPSRRGALPLPELILEILDERFAGPVGRCCGDSQSGCGQQNCDSASCAMQMDVHCEYLLCVSPLILTASLLAQIQARAPCDVLCRVTDTSHF